MPPVLIRDDPAALAHLLWMRMQARDRFIVGIDGAGGPAQAELAAAIGREVGAPCVHLGDLTVNAASEELETLTEDFVTVIVEGTCLLEAADRLGLAVDCLVLVERAYPNSLGMPGSSGAATRYARGWRPCERADVIYQCGAR